MADELTPPDRRVRIPEGDEELLRQCEVETMRSGGPGGQHANKTESAVRLRHRPTGIVVRCESHRSQLWNRREALRTLRERLTCLNHRRKKRLPTRVPRSVGENRLKAKKQRKVVKEGRRRPDAE